MTANELMIGDWVFNKSINKPMQVYPMMLSQMFRQRPDATTEDYNIFPIPLTSEILLANGFEKDPETGECLLSDYDDTFEVYWIGTILTVQSGYGRMELVNCQYVYQLQHALKLCGINKEIVL